MIRKIKNYLTRNFYPNFGGEGGSGVNQQLINVFSDPENPYNDGFNNKKRYKGDIKY